MYELIHCRCGLIYGERPETYSSSNPHPRNFCPERAGSGKYLYSYTQAPFSSELAEQLRLYICRRGEVVFFFPKEGGIYHEENHSAWNIRL